MSEQRDLFDRGDIWPDRLPKDAACWDWFLPPIDWKARYRSEPNYVPRLTLDSTADLPAILRPETIPD